MKTMNEPHPDAESGKRSADLWRQAEETLLKAGALQNAIFNSANFSAAARRPVGAFS